MVEGRIDFFIVHYKADIETMEYRRKIDVAVGNSSDIYRVRLSIETFTESESSIELNISRYLQSKSCFRPI